MKKKKYVYALGFLLFILKISNVNAMITNEVIKDDLYYSAKKGNVNRILNYINSGYYIDEVDEDGMTALCTAREDNDMDAYRLLLRYGANPNHKCMQKVMYHLRKAKEEANSWNKYINKTSLITTGLVAGAVALAAGGGGSGGSGGDSGGGSGGDSGGDSEDWNSSSKSVPTVADIEGASAYLSAGDLSSTDEYSGKNFTQSVNYLAAINAEAAYLKAYAKDKNGNLTYRNDVIESNGNIVTPTYVAVLDRGVWGSNNEFTVTDASGNKGSKIGGFNLDYGPCLNGDTTNCWKLTSAEVTAENAYKLENPDKEFSSICQDGVCFREIVLYDENGEESSTTSYASCNMGDDGEKCDAYKEWSSEYPSDYNWDDLKYYYYPNVGEDHGTNVAGLIAANTDGNGNMGVSSINTYIYAVRWDLKSSFSSVADTLLNTTNKIRAVNASLGTNASATSNASLLNPNGSNIYYIPQDDLLAYQKIIESYTNKTGSISGSTYKDGMIIVQAAGNDSYSNPGIEIGIKNVNKTFGSENQYNYTDLLMLAVVSVDVTLDENGTISSYKISEYSNKCGVASSYCIAAPGGTSLSNVMMSAGNGTESYSGMYGTSQATPIVTGSIAFLSGLYPYLSSGEIIEVLLDTANKEKADSFDASTYGAGLLDLGKATSYIANPSGLLTLSSNNINGNKINLNNTRLVVPSTLKNSVLKALPKNITIFDKYSRPFDYSTQHLVSTTHGDYKTFKNDVYNIANKPLVNKIEKNGYSFSFANSTNNIKNSGLGYLSVKVNNGDNVSGFYFSENTAYNLEKFSSSKLNNPFMKFNNAYGVVNTYNFTDNLGFKTELVVGKNGLYDGERSFNDSKFTKNSYSLNTELQVHQSKNYALNFSSGILYEDDAMLGMNGNGAFDVASTQTYNVGAIASWYATPELTLSGSYYQGFTKSSPLQSDLINFSNLVTDSFALDANYQYDKLLDFGVQVSSPLRVKNGTVDINFPSGRDNYSDEVYFNRYSSSVKSDKREYKFSLYFNKIVSDSLSFRSEFDIRLNPNNQDDKNDYQALFGLNWNFN